MKSSRLQEKRWKLRAGEHFLPSRFFPPILFSQFRGKTTTCPEKTHELNLVKLSFPWRLILRKVRYTLLSNTTSIMRFSRKPEESHGVSYGLLCVKENEPCCINIAGALHEHTWAKFCSEALPLHLLPAHSGWIQNYQIHKALRSLFKEAGQVTEAGSLKKTWEEPYFPRKAHGIQHQG